MTNSKQTKNINEFVTAFLKTLDVDVDVLDAWNNKDNQKKLTKLVDKGKKVRKDPTKPKRSKSSYLFFCQDNRKDMDSNLSATQVTTELGKMWKELKGRSDSEANLSMDRYTMEAEQDKVRYQKEMSTYVPRDMTKKVKKDPNKPKRSKSSYIFFCARHRAEIKEEFKGGSSVSVVRELGKRWQDLKIDSSTEGKKEMAELIQQASLDKLRFATEMEKYNSSNDSSNDSGNDSSNDSSKDSSKDSSNDSSNKLSSGDFKVFAVSMRSKFKVDFPTLKASQITAKMGKAWRELTDEEKQKW